MKMLNLITGPKVDPRRTLQIILRDVDPQIISYKF